MLNIPKPIIKYSLLANDEILLEGVKDFDGQRINVILRQATPEDMDSFEIFQKEVTSGKISARTQDERSLAKLIVRWGDRESVPTSIEFKSVPIETRGVLLEVFQQFCVPSYQLVEATDTEGAT